MCRIAGMVPPQKQLPRARSPSPPPPPIISDDLVLEILARLPVKSLKRFRSVCKSWQCFISDPKFVKIHLRRSVSNAEFGRRPYASFRPSGRAISLALLSLRYVQLFTISGVEDLCHRFKNKIAVVGSCNGLLCLVGLVLGRKRELEYRVGLSNPSARLIPKRLPSFHESDWREIRFAQFGFGYDHASDAYKVVAILFDAFAKKHSKRSLVKIYSTGDKCWRQIQSFPAFPYHKQSDGAFVSGTLNWVALRRRPVYVWDYRSSNFVTNDQLVIVSLDLERETYRTFLLPHVVDEDLHAEPALGVLRGCLCVSRDYNRTHFVVWQMKEFGVEKSWTLLLKVCYQNAPFDKLRWVFQPLCMYENGDVLIAPNPPASRVILYNRRYNTLQASEVPNNITAVFDAKLYVESLVWPY